MGHRANDAGEAPKRRLFDLPYLLLTLTALFWSGNFVLARAVHASVPPIGLAFWRWLGGFVILVGFAWPHLKRDRTAIARSWKIVLLLSAVGIGVFNTLTYIGLQSTTALNALLLQSTMPVMIVVFSFLLFREAVSARQMIGIALSLAGAAIIIGHGDPLALLRISLNRGDLWVIAAVASYAIYSALLRKRPVIHPLSFLATTFLAGALMLAPFYAWESWSGRLVSLDTPTLTAIGYVAIFPSILAYLCFNRGVELVGANRAGLFVHLMPVFGSLMAVLFLGERLEPFHGAGILFILAGIAIATRKA